MEKPSPQFISKLEQDLRLAYRSEFKPEKAPWLGNFLKLWVPAFSGALVIALLLMNFSFRQSINSPAAVSQSDPGAEARLITFSEGKAEEEIIADFDNDELAQIDNGVRLAADGNY